MIDRNSDALIGVIFLLFIVLGIVAGADLVFHHAFLEVSKSLRAAYEGSDPSAQVASHPFFTAKLIEKLIHWATIILEIVIPIIIVIKLRMVIANTITFIHRLFEKIIILTFYTRRLLIFKNQ